MRNVLANHVLLYTGKFFNGHFFLSQHRATGSLFTVEKKIFLPLGVILRSNFGCAVTHVTVYYWPRVPVGAKNDIHRMIIHKVVTVIYHFSR